MKHFYVFFILSFSHTINAQKLYGGEIRMKSTSALTYSCSVLIDMDTQINPSAKPYILVDWGDLTPLDTLFQVISYLCSSNANTMLFTKNHAYSSVGNYTISCTDGSLTPGLNNIPSSANKNLELRYDLNINPAFFPSTSPIFQNCLTTNISSTQNMYNPSEFQDAEADSIYVQLFTPNYYPGISAPAFTVNSLNGLSTYTGNLTGGFFVPLRISEYRKVNNVSTLVGTSYRFHTLFVTSISGINEKEKMAGTKLFPIPAKDYLQINATFSFVASYMISNYLGEKITTKNNLQTNNRIDISFLSKGIYFLTLYYGERSEIIKFIKD